MPLTSTRRSAVQRDVRPADGSDLELPESSPSRPSRKKRRTDKFDPSQPPADVERSADLKGANLTQDDGGPRHDNLVNAVVSNLTTAPGDVKATIDHANEVLERQYQDGIQAYAKIAGRNWTYYVKRLKVNIGRPPDPVQPTLDTPSQSSVANEDEDGLVHIDLGPSKLVSRQHALIEYPSNVDSGWQLSVNGRNGVRVNDQSLKRGGRLKLQSGDVLEIGGTQMMFVTPDEEPNIHPMYLPQQDTRASREENNHVLPTISHVPRSSSSQQVAPVAHAASSGPVPLAPAPPDYKRPSTPNNARGAGLDGKSKQSPPYNRGLMLETTGEIDYSLDSAKDLKPPYSYATMIGKAILASEEEKLTLNSIYQWIMEEYAFYRHLNSGWQNSIRHNLSLNKSFEKIPRRTDEPGKGMKWQIVPAHRDEFTKRASRTPQKGGNRGSSGPNSPASKEGSYTFHNNNSNNSNNTGRMSYGTSNDDVLNTENRLKQSSRSATPPLSSYPVAAKEAFTPDRGSRVSTGRQHEHGMHDFDDGSPLPISRSKGNTSSYGLSDAAQGSPPTLSSSVYMDEHRSMITPAPRRQLPRLAPPSTAQVPSAYMPTSSPAPFWKYLDFGSTPAKPMPDLSPSKSGGAAIPPSSSPPPPAPDGKDTGSPSKPGTRKAAEAEVEDGNGKPDENGAEDGDEGVDDMGRGIDLAR
ncbi:MAG: transcription factor [Sclerophora amabilis]|nr:MAG: transcription factor [Sclerophora amabilis]